jgi:hypothetical protein
MQKPSVFFLVLIGLLCSQCIHAPAMREVNADYLNRARLLTDVIADDYVPPAMTIGDPEKYYWPKAIARMHKYGHEDSIANAWISALKDRSPFHFTLVGMARLMSLYPEAPSMIRHKTDILQQVFDRTDSHNAWTSEGTENHINMDRTSGYLFAQHALSYPVQFPEAPEKLAIMKQWIKDWSKTIYTYGTGEWNSSIYQTYSILGWLNLYDFAIDEEVRLIARAVLDYYTAEMALHYSWGGYGGSEKRGRGVRGNPNGATHYLCWLWFGVQNDSVPFVQRGGEYIQSIHAVTSTYFPPEPLVDLARKDAAKPAWYMNSKPSYLFETPSFVKQFFYFDQHFSMGSALSPYGGWTGATSQLVNWKLVVATENPDKPHQVSGNGRFHDNWSGSMANPWTQIAQYKHTLIQLTLTPAKKWELIHDVEAIVRNWAEDWQRDFSARFPNDDKPNVVNFARNILADNTGYITLPFDARLDFAGKYCLADLGKTWVAVYFVASDVVSEAHNLLIADDRKILIDKAPDGTLCGFVIEVASADQYENFDAFKQAILMKAPPTASMYKDMPGLRYQALTGDTIETYYQTYGVFSEALYDWGYGAHEQQSLITSPPFRQPDWPSGEGYGRMPLLRINGLEVALSDRWSVFDGPQLFHDNEVLKITGSTGVYSVDYSGALPLFNHQ